AKNGNIKVERLMVIELTMPEIKDMQQYLFIRRKRRFRGTLPEVLGNKIDTQTHRKALEILHQGFCPSSLKQDLGRSHIKSDLKRGFFVSSSGVKNEY
ncbi:hypothetical protein, partial [Thioclava sp. F1Mire-8]|uniref:hypothetical protein n=1 Tax=Thioclava sp. F1Mire-8 TaxID=1973006 RepID=UPI00197EBCFC